VAIQNPLPFCKSEGLLCSFCFFNEKNRFLLLKNGSLNFFWKVFIRFHLVVYGFCYRMELLASIMPFRTGLFFKSVQFKFLRGIKERFLLVFFIQCCYSHIGMLASKKFKSREAIYKSFITVYPYSKLACIKIMGAEPVVKCMNVTYNRLQFPESTSFEVRLPTRWSGLSILADLSIGRAKHQGVEDHFVFYFFLLRKGIGW